MRVVYADSGAFIALLWRRDRAHERVRDHYRGLREAGDVLLTSNLVVTETATRLRYDAGLPAALAFRGLLAGRTSPLARRPRSYGVSRIRDRSRLGPVAPGTPPISTHGPGTCSSGSRT